MAFYTGTRKDYRGLVDTGYILGLFNLADKKLAAKRYIEFTRKHLDTGNVKGIMKCMDNIVRNITHDERKVIIREAKPGQVMALVTERLKLPSRDYMQLKYRRAAGKARAFLAFVQRVLCGLSYREICSNIGNMSMAGISRLCSEGFRLYMEEQQYRALFQEVVSLCRA